MPFLSNTSYVLNNSGILALRRAVPQIQPPFTLFSLLNWSKGIVKGNDARTDVKLCYTPGLIQPLHAYGVKFLWILLKAFHESPQGKTVILVVVNRLSKYAYCIPVQQPFNARQN